MPKKPPIDWETRARAVGMYRDGFKVREIEAALGISSGAIYNALRAWKVKLTRTKKTESMDHDAVLSAYTEGKSTHQLREEFGVSRTVLSKIIHGGGAMRPAGFQLGGGNAKPQEASTDDE